MNGHTCVESRFEHARESCVRTKVFRGAGSDLDKLSTPDKYVVNLNSYVVRV